MDSTYARDLLIALAVLGVVAGILVAGIVYGLYRLFS